MGRCLTCGDPIRHCKPTLTIDKNMYMYCDATCIVMHDDAMPIMLNVEHRNVRLHSTEPSKHQAKKVTLLKQDDNQAPGPEYISNNSYVHYDGTYECNRNNSQGQKSEELQDDARLKFYVKWCPKMARPANMVPEKEMALNGSCCGPSCGLGRSHVGVDFVKRESNNVITDTGDDSRKHFLKWEAS